MNKNYNIALAKALIFLRPNHPTGHTILAKAFTKEKVLDRALECWTEARSRFPNQDKIIRGRIRTLKALHRFDEAIMEAEHLIALRPDDPSGYVYRARVLMTQERFDLALESWVEARSRFPRNSDVIQGQIRALQKLSRFEEGLTEAQHAIDADPKQPHGYVCVADLLTEQRRYSAALEQWNRIGRLFPGHVRVGQGRCRALRELDQYDEALIEADRLIAEKPSDPIGCIERFDILYRASFYRESYSFIREQLRRHGSSPTVLNRFVSAAIVVKGKEFARRFCYRLLRKYPHASSLLVERYLFLSAETGDMTGVTSASSKFPIFASVVNDKINLVVALCHASNLDMYKALDRFIEHSLKKHSIFTISQIIVMSAVLGDRVLARKGLIALYRYQEIYRLNQNQPIYTNIRMHLRFNIISDEIETVMAGLAPLMKQENYERAFDIASDYLGDHPMETSLSCVYLIAALKSGAYEFESSGGTPEPRMMFYWDNAEIPLQIRGLIDINKSNNPGLECHVHNDESAKEFLKEHFDSYVLSAYNNANHPSQKGDIFRLAYLYKMGGYYIDVDDLVFVDLGKYFAGVGSAYFVESIGHVGNNFLATVSGNRVFEDMLIEASENVSTGAFGGCIWRGTGPGLVNRHVARQVNDIIQNRRERNVRIALPWEHKKISTYHLTLNYKKAGFHWMGGDEAEEQDG